MTEKKRFALMSRATYRALNNAISMQHTVLTGMRNLRYASEAERDAYDRQIEDLDGARRWLTDHAQTVD
jgi:hypothetical protein